MSLEVHILMMALKDILVMLGRYPVPWQALWEWIILVVLLWLLWWGLGLFFGWEVIVNILINNKKRAI
jgi:hypothetical protein